jgi:hypothetical protein
MPSEDDHRVRLHLDRLLAEPAHRFGTPTRICHVLGRRPGAGEGREPPADDAGAVKDTR